MDHLEVVRGGSTQPKPAGDRAVRLRGELVGHDEDSSDDGSVRAPSQQVLATSGRQQAVAQMIDFETGSVLTTPGSCGENSWGRSGQSLMGKLSTKAEMGNQLRASRGCTRTS